jgi:hypothetical protein
MGLDVNLCGIQPELGILALTCSEKGGTRMNDSMYAKHGGIHFIKKRSEREINSFVSKLPAEKKDSLFEVLDQLSQAGFIQIVNDGKFADGEGKLEGSDEC